VLTAASRDGHRVAIRGSGTKAAAPVDGLVLSTLRLNAIVAHRHGDLTATVQAGATLADVNRALAVHRQWIPLDPPFADRATIGGIVATNDSGPRRHRYGAPRDLIIGAEFVRADGVAAKAGGIVVKNVAGYDVARLLTGSRGSLAVIVAATFKLYPLPPASRTAIVDVAGFKPCAAFLEMLLASQLTPTAIELQLPPGRLLVRFETIETAAEQQAAAVTRLAVDAGARASIVRGQDDEQAWREHGRRPWDGDGAVLKIAVLPADVVPTVEWLAGRGVDYDIVGRAGVGVLLARMGGDAAAQARIVQDLRTRIGAGRGSVVIVRASDDLLALADPLGPLGAALPLMQAIKRRFDPAGILPT